MSLHGFYVRFQNISFIKLFLSDIQTIFGNGFADRKSGPVYVDPGEIIFLSLTSDVARSFEFGTIRTLTDQGLATSIILAGTDMNLVDGVPVFIGATPLANGEVGLVPQPLAGQDQFFLRGDGSWAVSPSTPDPFIGASPTLNGEEGIVPQPLAGEDEFFLKGDGTWAPAPGAIAPFTGATPTLPGTEGIVPQPLAGQEDFMLFGDGTWKADPSPTPPIFTGATLINPGLEGLVPAPLAGQDTSVLVGDGTWQDLLFPTSYEVVVTPSGDDPTADGSPYRPFGTLTAAINFVNSNVGPEGWLVRVQPGDYSQEAPITLTRPRTSIVGDSSSPYESYLTRIPSFVIDPAYDTGGISQNEFSFSKVCFAGEVDTALTVTGSIGCSVYLTNVHVTVSQPGQGCLAYTNTVGVRSKVLNCFLENDMAGEVNIQLNSPGSFDCYGTFVNCGNAEILTINTTNLSCTFNSCSLEGEGLIGASVNNNCTLNLLNSYFTTTLPNSTGVLLSGTSQLTSVGSVLTIPITLIGYVVDGPGACSYYHGNNSYMGTTRVHNTLTAVLIANTISLVA